MVRALYRWSLELARFAVGRGNRCNLAVRRMDRARDPTTFPAADNSWHQVRFDLREDSPGPSSASVPSDVRCCAASYAGPILCDRPGLDLLVPALAAELYDVSNGGHARLPLRALALLFSQLV